MLLARRLLLIAVCALSVTGCASHLYNVAGQKSAPVISRPYEGAIVPTDRKKTSILMASGIVAKSGSHRAIRLTALETYPSCGMPLLITCVSFGLIPSVIPEPMDVTVEVVDHHKISTTIYSLRLLSRYSLWENLSFFHKDELAISRALAWAYANGKAKSRSCPERQLSYPPSPFVEPLCFC
jgi:hypothetical protein